MKKLLAIVISMAMIVAMMPAGVFAAECTKDDSCTIHEAVIGTTHYDTLAKAIEAVKAIDTIIVNDRIHFT